MFCHCSRLILVAVAMGAAPGSEPPTNWVDPDTGHRIVRLTKEPGSASIYFNQNGYTADGKKMVYTTPGGISVLDLKTHAAKSVVQGKVRIIVTGRKTQSVYYTKQGAVYASDVDTRAARYPPSTRTRPCSRVLSSRATGGTITAPGPRGRSSSINRETKAR